MMYHLRPNLLTVLVVVVYTATCACGAAAPGSPSSAIPSNRQSGGAVAPAEDQRAPQAPPPAPVVGTKPAASVMPATASSTAAPASMILYQGDISVMVDGASLSATADKIIDLAEAAGGYLGDRRDSSVQIRVPSARFRETLQAIGQFGEVTHQSVSAVDVSEEYNDLEVRLQNLKAEQKRLHEFLAKATSIADMLAIDHELQRVTAEIDTIEGRAHFLKSRATYSVINVNLQPKPVAVKTVTPPPPPPRALELGLDWLNRLGIDSLLNLVRTETP